MPCKARNKAKQKENFGSNSPSKIQTSIICIMTTWRLYYNIRMKYTLVIHSTFFSWEENTPNRSISAWALLRARRDCLSSAWTSSMRVAMAASLEAVSCSKLSSRHSPSAAARFWLLTESANAFTNTKGIKEMAPAPLHV